MMKRILRKLKILFLRTSVLPYSRFLGQQTKAEFISPAYRTAVREKLQPAYEQYIREVSSPEMAASLELATFLFCLCRANEYKRVADLGSGFSSYTFRTYAQGTSGVEVFSIDDDERWLDKTKQFLSAHKLDGSGMMTMEQFNAGGPSGFDCILHDLNFVEERIAHVEELLNRVNPGGMIIFDDVHKGYYLGSLLEVLSRYEGSIYTLRPVTLDSYGRYSLAYLRPH